MALGIVGLLVVGIVALGLSIQLVEVTIPQSFLSIAEPAPPTRPLEGATPVTQLSAASVATEPLPAAPGPAAANAQDDPAADAAPAPATAQAASAAASAPAASALTVGGTARVVNTDGKGVVLYGAPRASARQPAGLLEGTTVTVLELADTEWARVQSGSRQSGWVHAEFLAPAD